ncbi:MAG: hypothetical protein ABIQ93_16765 [Saprospiraceae bacterium]
MRSFALLLLFLSAAAYRGLTTDSPQVQVVAACSKGQATDILFESADGGKTWQDLSLGLPENLTVNCVFTQDGAVFLGTENGLFHSRDAETSGWEQEHVGKVATNELGVITLNERVTGIYAGRSGLYVCVAGSGFFRKIPGTNRWQPMHEALADKTVQNLLECADGTIFVGCSSGIYKSKDDGKTWKHVFTEGWASNLFAAGDVIMGNGYQGLLRSTDGGEHWDTVLADKGGIYNTSVIDGRLTAVRVGGTFASAATAIALRTSADGGQTWARLDQGLSTVGNIYDLQQAGDYLFCSHKAGISRSVDGGSTWELVYPAPETDKPIRLEISVSGQKIFLVQAWDGC